MGSLLCSHRVRQLFEKFEMYHSSTRRIQGVRQSLRRALPVVAGLSLAFNVLAQEESSSSGIETGAKAPEKVAQKEKISPVPRVLSPLMFSDSEDRIVPQKVAPESAAVPQSAVAAVPASPPDAANAPALSRDERIEKQRQALPVPVARVVPDAALPEAATASPAAAAPSLAPIPAPVPPATVTPVDEMARPVARVAPATVPMAGPEEAPVAYPYERPGESAPAMPLPPQETPAAPQVKTRSITPTLPGSKLLDAMGISIEEEVKKVGNEARAQQTGEVGRMAAGDEIPSTAATKLPNGRVMTTAEAGDAAPSFPGMAPGDGSADQTKEELKATSKVYSAVTAQRPLPSEEATAENPYPRPAAGSGQTYSSIAPVIPHSQKLDDMGIDMGQFARITYLNEPDPAPGMMAGQQPGSESWLPPGSSPGGAYAATATVEGVNPEELTAGQAMDVASGESTGEGAAVGRKAEDPDKKFTAALAAEEMLPEGAWDEGGAGPGIELPSYERNDNVDGVTSEKEKRGWSLLASFWKRGDDDGEGHAAAVDEESLPADLASQEETGADAITKETFEGMTKFPEIEMPDFKVSQKEKNIDWLIERVASAYAERVNKLNSVDVSLDVEQLPAVPSDFDAAWAARIREPVWPEGTAVKKGLDSIYSSALSNSHQIAALADTPLIRETAIQEAEGAYDFNSFLEGRYARTNEPTGSLLTTGERGRFLQREAQAEYGVKKKLTTGAEVSVSNRLSTLDSNSEFLDPNPQAGSELVLSVSQPLLQGAGYDYNTTALKVAKLDAKMGVSEFLRQLESYLLEISRTYWGVYLARAGYLQKVYLVDRTQEVVSQLEDRAKVDKEATASELLRARSALAERRSSLIRSEMAIRIAEERLRALVNDPNFHLGSNVELIPQTRPILGPPHESVRQTAELAIANRPELLESIYQVQAAGLRRDLSKNELLPTLDLILETTVAGIDDGRNIGNAWGNQFSEGGPGWLAGVKFEMPWERNMAKARDLRRKHELRQQVNQLRSTLDSVMLEAVVAYQELRTSYRDMQGKYQAVLASREELAELEARLDVEAAEEGKSVGYQLQLILDSIERNEQAEEAFLVAVVVYNTAFTTLDRARGTLLHKHGVTFDRTVGDDGLQKIESSVGGTDPEIQ